METNLQHPQIEIVVVAKHHDPSALNHDYLVRHGVVKDEWGWQLARPAYSTPMAAGLVYNSGISVTARADRLIFADANPASIPELTPVGEIALNYLKAQTQIEPSAVGVNPKAHLAVEHVAVAREFVMSRLIQDGPWKNWGEAPVSGAARFVYQVDGARLLLTVDVASLRTGPKEQTPCVLLQGNFHRDLPAEDPADRSQQLEQVVRNWRSDYERFLEAAEIVLGGE